MLQISPIPSFTVSSIAENSIPVICAAIFIAVPAPDLKTQAPLKTPPNPTTDVTDSWSTAAGPTTRLQSRPSISRKTSSTLASRFRGSETCSTESRNEIGIVLSLEIVPAPASRPATPLFPPPLCPPVTAERTPFNSKASSRSYTAYQGLRPTLPAGCSPPAAPRLLFPACFSPPALGISPSARPEVRTTAPTQLDRVNQRQDPLLHLLGREWLANVAPRAGLNGLLHVLLARFGGDHDNRSE